VEQLCKLFWDNTKNHSRLIGGLYKDIADQNRLVGYLVPGWNAGLGRVLVTPMTEPEQKAAVQELAARMKALEDQGLDAEPESVSLPDGKITFSPMEQLHAFRQVHCDAKGKIIVPKYRGITCFRRGNALLKANTIRLKQGKAPITEVPVEVRDYGSNAMSEIEDNLLENIAKTRGSRGVNNAALVAACKNLYQLGASESAFQKRIFRDKRGMAQKMHRLCKLDAKHPALKIIDRICDPADELTAKPFDKEKVKKLLDNNATDEQVAKFVANPNAGKAAKIMARKDIESLQDQTPVTLFKLALEAVLKNDIGVLSKAVAHAAEINELTKEFVG
jgi:hypothetical protein